MWRRRTLASQILLGVLAVLFATVVVGGILYVQLTRRSLDHQYEQRARVIAATVANIPEIRSALTQGDPRHVISPLAGRIVASTGASYVVITDRTGVRFSHPNPHLIGQRLEEPVIALDGHDHVGIDHGSLGPSANGKVPIFDDTGRVIGEVSVGVLETQIATQLGHEIGAIALYSTLALAVGIAVATLLTRALKRVTFGLELRELATLLQEREAMLHGIREGVVGLDAKGRITLINDEARQLLDLPTVSTGRPLDEVIEPGRLHDLLTGEVTGTDQTVLTDDALLVVNRRPVVLAGRSVGSIVTIRDRTELEGLIRRMDDVTGLTNALRAQEHEFTNRLHVIAGLIDLGEAGDARQYLQEITQEHLVSAEDLRSRIAPATVAALLLAKMSIAAERDIELVVTDDSHLDVADSSAQTLMTIIGNLVDNALDAVAFEPKVRNVSVELGDDDEITIVVTDTGPGVPADALTEIFNDGYSTKPPRGEMRRGIGLALVRRVVHRAGGQIFVSPGPGARFEVRLPLPETTTDNIGVGSAHATRGAS